MINKRAGGQGLIVGRKAFQRPMAEGAALVHAVQDVFLDGSVTHRLTARAEGPRGTPVACAVVERGEDG